MKDNKPTGELQVSTTNLADEPVIGKVKRAKRARRIAAVLITKTSPPQPQVL